MTANKLSAQVSGKTIRLSWTDGPTKGTTQEHIFDKSGTVEWHSVEGDGSVKSSSENKPAKPKERPHYAAMKITDVICMVSYLSKSGYTLTVVLNFSESSVFAIASNEKEWFPARGNFEVVA